MDVSVPPTTGSPSITGRLTFSGAADAVSVGTVSAGVTSAGTVSVGVASADGSPAGSTGAGSAGAGSAGAESAGAGAGSVTVPVSIGSACAAGAIRSPASSAMLPAVAMLLVRKPGRVRVRTFSCRDNECPSPMLRPIGESDRSYCRARHRQFRCINPVPEHRRIVVAM